MLRNNRLAIWIMAALLVALLGLALAGYLTGNWNEDESARPGYGFLLASAETRPEPMCMDAQTREQMRALMLEALDNSLKQHIQNMFLVWMKDSTGQPTRARTGVEHAFQSYLHARKGALEWAPPLCAG